MNFLKRPFPIEVDFKSDILTVIIVTVFPPLFIVLFQPSDILAGFDQSNYLNWLVFCGFGIISGLMTLLAGVVLPYKFPNYFERMTILSASVYYLFFFLLVATAIFFYKTYWEGQSRLLLNEYLSVFKYTILIGLFPTIVILLSVQQKRLKFNLKAALIINDRLKNYSIASEVTIHSQSGTDVLKITQDNFLYAENADNYSWIYYLNNAKIEKKLFRISLKSLEKEFSQIPSFLRIHRSLIVNMSRLIKAEGNSRGLSLTIEHVDRTLPVSRKNIEKVTSFIES